MIFIKRLVILSGPGEEVNEMEFNSSIDLDLHFATNKVKGKWHPTETHY